MIERWLLASEVNKYREQTSAGLKNASSEAGTMPKLALEGPLVRKTLDRIRALGPAILARVVTLYLDSSPKLIQNMQEAVAQGDQTKLRSAAHSLKSCSANMGAETLAAICKELEDSGHNNNLANARAVLSVLESEYAAVRRALRAVVTERNLEAV